MAFQFSLAALLRFRQSAEQQQEAILQQANQQVSNLRRQIEDTQRAIEEIAGNDSEALTCGLRAAELHFSQLRHDILLQLHSRLEKELTVAIEIQLQQRLAYQKARQQREIVEALRQRQLQIYEEEVARQEQRRLDDLFFLRREFLRRESRRLK